METGLERTERLEGCLRNIGETLKSINNKEKIEHGAFMMLDLTIKTIIAEALIGIFWSLETKKERDEKKTYKFKESPKQEHDEGNIGIGKE